MAGRRLTAATAVVAVIGDPIGHSLSPSIHNAAFESAGLDWVMVALRVDRSSGESIIPAFRTFDLVGLAVTAPHKQAVARGVDVLDPTAVALDSVNTVYRSGDSVAGTSTDGDGFVASLIEADVDLAGRSVAVLGAGGAARSVIVALGRAGVGRVAVINRTPENAVVAAALTTQATAVDTADAPEAIATADLVVNATTVGMGESSDDEMPIAADLLRRDQVVADLVYHPLETALLAAARAAGAHCVDGLGMLVHQAALQQRLWTGAEPDLVAMRKAAHSALDRPR